MELQEHINKLMVGFTISI